MFLNMSTMKVCVHVGGEAYRGLEYPAAESLLWAIPDKMSRAGRDECSWGVEAMLMIGG